MVKIVLLFYNKTSLTLNCLESILSSGYSIEEILCLDNGSLPETKKKLLSIYPDLQIHRIEPNGGYSAGFNAGVKRAIELGAENLLFLTNDTLLTSQTYEKCKACADANRADMVAPLILNAHNGTMDSVGGYFDPDSLTLKHHRSQGLPDLLGEWDYVPGTAFWLSKRAFERLDGMDESYFMFWEDVDFSIRAHSQGLRLARCYEAAIQHSIGKSTRKKAYYTTYLFQRNRIRFTKTHLDAEKWQQAKVILETELETLTQKWTEDRDELRLGYADKLRTELG